MATAPHVSLAPPRRWRNDAQRKLRPMLGATTTQILGLIGLFTGLLAAVVAGTFAWFTQRGLARRRELWDARSVARLVEGELLRSARRR